jgi:endonuclease/exonuclease/phosphatase family metal-dependent hydrolase
MTYNLLYGFHEREGDALVYRDERARAAAEVVRAAAPDLLALTEAVYVGPGGRVVRHDFAALFGLPHVACRGFDGEWASALASRFPISRVERLPLGRHPGGAPPSALRTTVDCAGRALHVDVVHPSPHVTEAERVEAFAPLLASRATPYLLAGDLNALSDEDEYDAAALAAQMVGRVPEPQALAARMLDRQLVASVRAHDLVDAMPAARRGHTLPTRLPRPHDTQGAELRIDYLFVSRDVRVLDAEVIRRAPADEASDHYPVVATLEL